jgi:AcrR family transcriptional regulator
MTPRRYDMSKRGAARDELRERILSATIDLHTEKGILGTSWKDIADRADVAVATVYNHYPSLDELVPACGELLMTRLRPPGPQDAVDVIGEGGTTMARLERAGRHLFEFYARGGAHLDIFPGERDLPEIREWEAYQRATVEAFVRVALKGTRTGRKRLQLVSAMFDLTTFRSLEGRGFEAREAATLMARAATCTLDRSTPARPREGGQG